MSEEYTTWTFKSEGYDEAYTRYLEKKLRLSNFLGWGAIVGWFMTAVILMGIK